MSTHIIDQVIAIKLPLRHPEGEQHFVIVHEGGDNNLIDCITHHRCRSWYVTAFGREYEILREACKWAESCCGGCTRFSGYRHTEPETFIRRYRNSMKDAMDLKQASEAGIHIAGRIKFDTNEPQKEGLWKIDQVKKYGVAFESKPDSVAGQMVHKCDKKFNLLNPEEFNQWFDATNNFHARERLEVTCYDYRPWVLKKLKKDKTREKAGMLA